jgi:hypothetical protein
MVSEVPDFYYAVGQGAKQKVLDFLKQNKWGLCDPYCFQTRGSFSTFFAYRLFGDGVARVSELLQKRKETLPRGENIGIEQIYEHCWGKNRFRKLFIDYEIEEAWYQKNRTVEQIETMARSFPRWMFLRLRDMGFIDSTTEVRVVVKDKCRDLPKGRKISFHFIFNIVATSLHHELVCERIFSKYAPVKKSITQDKIIPMDFYDDCAVGVDLQTLKGERGYSTPYSKKQVADPDCVVSHKEIHTLGEVKRIDLSTITNRSNVIYLASYTCPDPDTVIYAANVLRSSLTLVRLPPGLAPGSSLQWAIMFSPPQRSYNSQAPPLYTPLILFLKIAPGTCTRFISLVGNCWPPQRPIIGLVLSIFI